MITATVPQSCEVGNVQTPGIRVAKLDLGTQAIEEAGEPAAAIDMPIRCSDPALVPKVSISAGNNPDGATRQLRGPGGQLIPYELRRGWGAAAEMWDTQPHPIELALDGSGAIPLTGHVPHLPAGVADGLYADTIVITISLDN